MAKDNFQWWLNSIVVNVMTNVTLSYDLHVNVNQSIIKYCLTT